MSGLLPQIFEIFFFLLANKRTQEKRSEGGKGRKRKQLSHQTKHRECENWLQNTKYTKQGAQPDLFPFLFLARQAPYISFNGLISVIWVYFLCWSNFLERLSYYSANGYRLGWLVKPSSFHSSVGGKFPHPF